MLPTYFIFIAAALRLSGGMAYFKATLSGRAKPNPISWLLWSITPMIAFAAELSAGVGPSAYVTLALGLSPLLVFLAAMYKNPKLLKLDRLDVLCVLIAALGIILWKITSHPQLAIALVIFADISSAMPTIRKIMHSPHTEYLPTYIISATSMVITLLAIKDFSFASLAFPLYILTINLFLIILITHRSVLIKKRKNKRKPKTKRKK